MQAKIKRFQPNLKTGLTKEQVNIRIRENLVNIDTSVPTKSIGQIIALNTFTLFNFLILGLGFAVFLVGSYKNMLFLGVIICNTLISIFQEVRSKKIIDKLSLLAATKAKVIRNGKREEIEIEELVLDDLVLFETGNQVVADSIIVDGSCEVNEAFITGESDPVYKKEGDMILSGSFIVSGKVLSKVEHVGSDNYTSKISADAKYLKKLNSELMYSLKKIIKYISIIIVPLGLILFWNQINIPNNEFNNAVINTVAAIIGMIPDGLILLTSTVLAVSVIKLSKYNVLVQELYCIEMLARVDTICLDKTGTITEGTMEFVDFVHLNKEKISNAVLNNVFGSIQEINPTMQAIKEKYNEGSAWLVKRFIPFSSKRKYSGVEFEKRGSYILGAPEFVLEKNSSIIKNKIDKYVDSYRVLLLGYSDNDFTGDEKPKNIKPLGLILLRDKIRNDAVPTLNYFKEQGVRVKIISGDNPKTVASIASRVGLDTHNNHIDTSNLSDAELKEAVLKYDIFGRVSPIQKKIIITTLKENGHTVAMTGDGVNDVLALKEADCSIAMASGSDAARNVSQVVLLDSNFSSMPKILLEGRKTINNITRSASLFLVKTVYATVLAILFVFINMTYPFQPIQMTLLSVLTIGVPSLILALEPNYGRIQGKFLTNVFSNAIPTAVTVIFNILIITLISSIIGLGRDETSTMSLILTGYTGFLLIYNLCLPFNWPRAILMSALVFSFVISLFGFQPLFSLVTLNPLLYLIVAIMMVLATMNFNYLTNVFYKIKARYPKFFT